MPRRPKIKITCVDRLGKCPCHRGHRVGDSWDFDKDRGQICPMVMHVAFPFNTILLAASIGVCTQKRRPIKPPVYQ